MLFKVHIHNELDKCIGGMHFCLLVCVLFFVVFVTWYYLRIATNVHINSGILFHFHFIDSHNRRIAFIFPSLCVRCVHCTLHISGESVLRSAIKRLLFNMLIFSNELAKVDILHGEIETKQASKKK